MVAQHIVWHMREQEMAWDAIVYRVYTVQDMS